MRTAFQARGDVPYIGISPSQLARDPAGVGGFMESILAIIIVTSGLSLLTFSFYFMAIEDTMDPDLQSQCEELIDLIMEDKSIMRERGMIDYSALEHLDISGIDADNEFKVAIDELSSGSIYVLGKKGTYVAGDVYFASVPINVYHSPKDIRPAILRVWTW